ncbi:MAG: putative DNA binding domain-containing protein, partial [Deltaproteobacteria bacterium]|nr:putative DNA binding domain-containing protein [Deltaproteobacteria bacterium]
MPNPKEVFENPKKHWSFVAASSDDEFEGQYFDRKEAGISDDNNQIDNKGLKSVKKQVTKCISAFANANREGGLLVLGVSKTGEIKGTCHLTEDQTNGLTAFGDLLRNQSARTRFLECRNSSDLPDKLLLIYTPYTDNGICETLDKEPKAWVRSGPQNLPVNEQMREQLKRDKKIVDYERARCCPFDIADIDTDVLAEFRKVFLEDASYEMTDEQLLYEAGIIEREGTDYTFNNAGLLFMSRNPQRVQSWAYIRLMRFEVNAHEEKQRGLPTFEKSFYGPVAQQIRKIRTFFRDSGFFKTYQKRNPEGGFIDDPEFPFIAYDEAIVNAVAHRDYGIQRAIECIYYKDAFVVDNPGRIIQRDQDLPPHFSLDTTSLNSMPRNSKLIEWLKKMRDEKGAAFVRAISEGTKKMQDEMENAGLPSPFYDINHLSTKVTLLNNAIEREALQKSISRALETTESANFFHLDFVADDGEKVSLEELRNRRKEFTTYLRDALQARGWYIDRFTFGRIIAHRRG